MKPTASDSSRVSASESAGRDQWQTLYDQYSVRVWRYVARIIGNDADAVADAVQETFLAAAKSCRQFDTSRGTEWVWLAGIAHRQAALRWRRVGRDRLRTSQGEVDSAVVADDPSELIQQLESAEFVRCVLAELAPDDAAILIAKYCDEFSVNDIVQQFGGTIEGVRSKLARARRQFKTHYERLGHEASSVQVQEITEHTQVALGDKKPGFSKKPGF